MQDKIYLFHEKYSDLIPITKKMMVLISMQGFGFVLDKIEHPEIREIQIDSLTAFWIALRITFKLIEKEKKFKSEYGEIHFYNTTYGTIFYLVPTSLIGTPEIKKAKNAILDIFKTL